MKSHFHPKTLAFYGTMIGSVLILFRIVSAYGEKHLQAPPDINGRYISTQAPPGCPDSTRLVLIILQSGVFLHSNLYLEQAGADPKANASQDKPSLHGRWTQDQITLAGPTGALTDCTATATTTPGQALPAREVTIQGQIQASAPAAPNTFAGEMTIVAGQPWQFSAERQAVEQKSSEH